MDAASVEAAFVVGFSMGAYFTANFALRHPARVSGMVLARLGTGSDEPEAIRASMLAVAAALRSERIDAFARPTEKSAHRLQLTAQGSPGLAPVPRTLA